MYQEILNEILNRKNGQTIIITRKDGKVTLQTDPLRSYLIYWPKGARPIVWTAVYNGIVIFSEADYEKWADKCKAAREGKIKQARPRQWRRTVGGWQEK
jgi:hypothetical protein